MGVIEMAGVNERFGRSIHLSGRDSLRALARRIGIGDRDVDAALERLGLVAEEAR